jgi:hypothetical protein
MRKSLWWHGVNANCCYLVDERRRCSSAATWRTSLSKLSLADLHIRLNSLWKRGEDRTTHIRTSSHGTDSHAWYSITESESYRWCLESGDREGFITSIFSVSFSLGVAGEVHLPREWRIEDSSDGKRVLDCLRSPSRWKFYFISKRWKFYKNLYRWRSCGFLAIKPRKEASVSLDWREVLA